MPLLFYFMPTGIPCTKGGILMRHNHKIKGTATGLPVGLAIGAMISLIITMAGAAVTAYLVLNERVGENGIGYAAIAVLFLAAVMGAWGAYSCIKKQRLQICLLSAGVYYLLLLAITALFFGGQYQGMGVTAFVVLIGTLIVAFFPGKGSAKMKFKKRNYR